MDMMMIGGEGCEDHADPDHPRHCPQQSDAEYRSVENGCVDGDTLDIGTD